MTYTGVNLAGAEFSADNLSGVYGKDYIYPSKVEVDYFFRRGLNTIRLPFRWESIQPSLLSPLDPVELQRIDSLVKYTTGRDGFIILDVHNFARYRNTVVGSAQLPADTLSDLWGRLAQHYGNNDHVILGLMNEPHDMATERWLDAANAAIAAIRAAGAGNLILVPGNGWTGAYDWQNDRYGTPNATVMPGIRDPLHRFAFEVHQYMDRDLSGATFSCERAADALAGMVGMTSWLRSHGFKGFLGEIGAGTSAECLDGLNSILGHVGGNPDVWLGWTYWAAGPWWGSYPFSVEPSGGNDRPQMAVLRAHAP